MQRAARSGGVRRMCSTVAETAAEEAPGPFSFSDPTFQGVLACVGAVYIGAGRWIKQDRSLAAEIAEKKAAHAAAHPEEAAAVHEAVAEEAAPTIAAIVAAASPVCSSGACITKWKTADVTNWLANLELPQHSAAFKAGAIDGTMLLTLTDADLHKELGVSSALHRKKIMIAVSELRKNYISP